MKDLQKENPFEKIPNLEVRFLEVYGRIMKQQDDNMENWDWEKAGFEKKYEMFLNEDTRTYEILVYKNNNWETQTTNVITACVNTRFFKEYYDESKLIPKLVVPKEIQEKAREIPSLLHSTYAFMHSAKIIAENYKNKTDN